MARQIRKVTLEKIAKEKLSKQVVKDIDSIEVEVWENVESGLSLEIDRKTITLRFNYTVSTKKLLTWFGGIATVTGGSITILKWLMPFIVGYFSKPPP